MLNPGQLSDLPATKAPPVIDDGVTKYKLTLKRVPALPASEVVELEKWRAILWRLGLVGEYPNEKIGYGNLSLRAGPGNAFIISGTQTGHLPHLQRHHYCKVVGCDLPKQAVRAEGLIAPSSESLTHHALYEANPQIHAVFHVHHREIWERLVGDGSPAVESDVPYGTKEMAEASARLIAGADQGHFVMKGHQDGFIAYGPTPEAAGRILLKLYRKMGPQPTP